MLLTTVSSRIASAAQDHGYISLSNTEAILPQTPPGRPVEALSIFFFLQFFWTFNDFTTSQRQKFVWFPREKKLTNLIYDRSNMFYAGTAASTYATLTPGIPGSRHYIPAAPMSAVLPGQTYYPTMHTAPLTAAPVTVPMSASPMVYGGHAGYAGYGGHAGYAGYGGYGYQQPTVILSSAPRSRRRHRHHGGFLGYLWGVLFRGVDMLLLVTSREEQEILFGRAHRTAGSPFREFCLCDHD